MLDTGNMSRYLSAFKRKAKGSPKLWGLHNYGDVNRRRTTYTKRMLRSRPRRGLADRDRRHREAAAELQALAVARRRRARRACSGSSTATTPSARASARRSRACSSTRSTATAPQRALRRGPREPGRHAAPGVQRLQEERREAPLETRGTAPAGSDPGRHPASPSGSLYTGSRRVRLARSDRDRRNWQRIAAPIAAAIAFAVLAAPAGATVSNVAPINGNGDPIVGDVITDDEELSGIRHLGVRRRRLRAPRRRDPGGLQRRGRIRRDPDPALHRPTSSRSRPGACTRATGSWSAPTADGETATAVSGPFTVVQPCPDCPPADFSKHHDFADRGRNRC